MGKLKEQPKKQVKNIAFRGTSDLKKYAPQFFINSAGEKETVLLKISAFHELMEDLQDLAIIAERRDDEYMPYEEFEQELKIEGKL